MDKHAVDHVGILLNWQGDVENRKTNGFHGDVTPASLSHGILL